MEDYKEKFYKLAEEVRNSISQIKDLDCRIFSIDNGTQHIIYELEDFLNQITDEDEEK